ncbi:UNVERIFIED_CONTAM: hypothetical protein Slati_3517000 [Sesamum latifolium]|uniref:Uncharacterized protein n=1 Tax=Sesamum latifolium TaxID=2727402 RepID=A0AAW2ULG7_9LAMI
MPHCYAHRRDSCVSASSASCYGGLLVGVSSAGVGGSDLKSGKKGHPCVCMSCLPLANLLELGCDIRVLRWSGMLVGMWSRGGRCPRCTP